MHLGVPEGRIKEIEKDYDTTARRVMEVIMHWKKNNDNCSWRTLADAVEKMGEHGDIVMKMRQLYQQNHYQRDGQGGYT